MRHDPDLSTRLRASDRAEADRAELAADLRAIRIGLGLGAIIAAPMLAVRVAPYFADLFTLIWSMIP